MRIAACLDYDLEIVLFKKNSKKFKNQILSDSLVIPDKTGTSQANEKEI